MDKGSGLPPRLGPPPPQKRRRLSRTRRAAQAIVWLLFAVVLAWRLNSPPEKVNLADVFPGLRRGEAGQQRGPGGPRGRWQRSPARVQPPVAPLPPDLWRIEIEIAPRDVNTLRGYFWNHWGGGPSPERPDVPATVRLGGEVYTNVALHLKGAAGSFRPFDDKPAMTLNFGKLAEGQKFRGYSKISLNNSVQDPTYLNEAICREMFLAAGVPTPRADHATVVVNGRDLGLYVLVEGWGKGFLKQHFKDTGGNLYDGGFLKDITEPLDTNSGDNRNDRSDLARLARAAFETDPDRRWERLNAVLDIDRFLSFLALEVMTCHWDGYAMNRNNYRVFHDRSSGRLVFMPHGMDQMFGAFRSSPNSPILPGMEGLVARAVITTPAGRKQYLERVSALRTNVFVPDRLTNRIHELSRRIRPTLAAYGPELAREHDFQVEALCERVVERAESITQQLTSSPGPTRFDADGVARLSGWRPRVTTQGGGAMRFERVEDNGAALLGIEVREGAGSASWRTRALLEPGRYRFLGRARTHGLSGDGGVCLRVSGTRMAAVGGRDDEWVDLSFRFVVEEALTEVELVCEFQGATGGARFEEASLRLVRE